MLRKSILTLILLAVTLASSAKSYIVCVGISDYPGTENDLNVCDKDALTIKKIFEKSMGAEVVLLTNQTATLANVSNKMKELFSKAGHDDTVIFYFSGHGLGKKNSFVCYDGFLNYRTIIDMMKNCGAKKKIVIADACFAGKMRNPNSGKQDHSLTKENVMFFLSSRTNETSIEGPYKNSIFTRYLERGLRGGADTNYDKKISAKEIFDFVHTGVIKESKGRQHPVMWGSFESTMPIVQW